MRRVAILGSTGSIGKQALNVISKHPSLFCAEVLTANTNALLLAEQAIIHKPNCVVIVDESKYEYLFDKLDPLGIKVFAGEESLHQIVENSNIDIVLSALVGFHGVIPTLNAIKSGKAVALANKEVLVAAGAIVMEKALEMRVPIIPVDSEHSAIFQSLQGEVSTPEKLILTSSGGPFLNSSYQEIENASVEKALNHPRWCMGSKISIDSATMMNKGFEMIEAHWLFGLNPNQIEILVHPQSIIHSMVQFTDGSVIAQLSYPDMRIPIQYALSYPSRLSLDAPRINFAELSRLDFYPPDFKKFPALEIAYRAIDQGGNMPCAVNAANEVLVKAFLEGKISLTSIAKGVDRVTSNIDFVKSPSLQDIIETNREGTIIAEKIITENYNS